MTRNYLLPVSLIAFFALFLTGCGGPNLLELASNPLGNGICGLVILILDVVAIVDLLGQNRTSSSKLIWILVIIFLPVLGLILYYLIARKGSS